MDFLWVLAASFIGLAGQWFWINGAALRSARLRTERALGRLKRELSHLSGTVQKSDGAELIALVVSLEAAAGEALESSLQKKKAHPTVGGALLRESVQAYERVRELIEGGGLSPLSPRENSEVGLRWGWVELARWDYAERLREEDGCWNRFGALWVGKCLGLAPISEPLAISRENPPDREGATGCRERRGLFDG